jgi:4-hydroxy-tetrahydrodipicolinate reductase
MDGEVGVVLFGLGPLGVAIAKGILEKKGIEIVGAVDTASELCGKDLGEVLKIGRVMGVTVTGHAEGLLSKVNADIAVVATKSSLRDVLPQIAVCANAGLDVISTCEELSYPYERQPELAHEIDELARKNGVTVLGTGINPGYLMDALPIALTGACLRVDSVKVTRMMDSSKRRIPFQKKIGTGLSPEEFTRMIRDKAITGHVGLRESAAMIAGALGWRLDHIKEFPPEPVIAQKQVVTPYTTVRPGHVAGLKSVAHGIKNGKPVIILEFNAHAGVEEEYDAVAIDGVPRIDQKIIGGIHGDVGTVAVIANMIPKVMNAEPGLVSMKDLPMPSAMSEDLRAYLRPR